MGRDRLRWPEGGDLTSWFVPVPLRPGVWLIAEPGHVNSYLVEGDERAALIDAGTGIAPLAPVVRRLTDRPVTVVLTHNHFDHVGGAHEFDRVAIHPAGIAGLRAGRPAGSLRGYIAEAGRLLERSTATRALDARGLNLLHPEQIVRPFPPGFDPDRYAIAPAVLYVILTSQNVPSFSALVIVALFPLLGIGWSLVRTRREQLSAK